MAAIRSHSLSVGIVGLPNSGKSTIFNALTKSAVPAENYPFCTIDKNVGVVEIPDKRLSKLAKILDAEKIVPAAIKFVDIAGLVKGASKGEGLGNKFLGHIREVSAIMYVLRAFHDDNITHVHAKIDPVDDLLVVRSELILKDIETVEKALDSAKEGNKSKKNDEIGAEVEALEKTLKGLSKEIPAHAVELSDEEREEISKLFLLTDKPAYYVLNISEHTNETELKNWIEVLKSKIPDEEKNFIITVDCKTEFDLDSFEEGEKAELVQTMQNYKGVKDIIATAYKRLDLITFYTGNKKEANAWSLRRGATAKEAAGVIHTDLANNFVSATVISVDDLLDTGSWVAAKEKGLARTESRDYIVQDGDSLIINASK